MNVLSYFSAFSADASKGDFIVGGTNGDGELTMTVPTSHNADSQTFGSGTLALQVTRDGGESYETYTDSEANEAELTSTGVTMRMYFAEKTRVRLNLSGSTNPDIDCVDICGYVRFPSSIR